MPIIKFNPLPAAEQEWESAGVIVKPPGCKFCPQSKKGTGFVYDYFPPAAKILFVLSAPENDDVVHGRALAGNMGHYRKKALLDTLGISFSQVAVSHIVRCHPGYDKFRKLAYPAKSVRVGCEKLCRQFDGKSMLAGQVVPTGIINFNPNVFVLTFDIEMLRNGAAFQHLMLSDIKRAMATIPRGGRPCVLFGEYATSLFTSYCFGPGQGGLKSWRGHIFEGSWKDLSIKDADVTEIEKTENPFRRWGKTGITKTPAARTGVFTRFAIAEKPAYSHKHD